MRRRLDRPPKRVIVIGTYLLLVPQLLYLTYALFLAFESIVSGAKPWSYDVSGVKTTIRPDAIAYECVKAVIVLGLIVLYSAILRRSC